MTTQYFKIGETQELEQFKKASSALARRARADKEVARQFFERIGYFEMMSQQNESKVQPRTRAQKRETIKNK